MRSAPDADDDDCAAPARFDSPADSATDDGAIDSLDDALGPTPTPASAALLDVAGTVAATACAAAAPTPVCPDGGAVAAQTEGRPAPSGPTAASLGAPNAPAPGAKFAFQETPGLTLLPGCTATPSEGGSGPSPRAMAPEAIADALTDVGGVMSHAAIVCREYGMPAVVGTGYSTKVIKTGMMLRVDGSSGHITIAR